MKLVISRGSLLDGPPGYVYPAWVETALGGIPATIDPMILTAGKTVGATLFDLLTDSELLAAAKTEFIERTGGGIGGTRWHAPLLPADFDVPHRLRWPEYVTTARGREWWIPWREDE